MTKSNCSNTDSFLETFQNWDLERLYNDLAKAKKECASHKKLGLTDVEKEYLRGLISGNSPEIMSEKLHKEIGGLKSYLSTTVYRYVEILTGKAPNTLKKWQDIAEWLAPEYKIEMLPPVRPIKEDLTMAPDTSVFFARTEEISALERLINKDKFRTIALWGMEGIGKTTLAVQLAQNLKYEFDYVIWRSLRYFTSCHNLLTDLLTFFSQKNTINKVTSETIDQGIFAVIKCLQEHHCLIILDSLENILANPIIEKNEVNNYHKFLQTIIEISHPSCLILITQENIKSVHLFNIKNYYFRTYKVSGLKTDVAEKLLRQEQLIEDIKAWHTLIDNYSGNPLYLKIVASLIKDIFDGNVTQFLTKSTLFLGEIKQILDACWSRLSTLEKKLIYQLALASEDLSIDDFTEQMEESIATSEIMEILQLLCGRSLIEKTTKNTQPLFAIQPVVKKYILKYYSLNSII